MGRGETWHKKSPIPRIQRSLRDKILYIQQLSASAGQTDPVQKTGACYYSVFPTVSKSGPKAAHSKLHEQHTTPALQLLSLDRAQEGKILPSARDSLIIRERPGGQRGVCRGGEGEEAKKLNNFKP